MSEIPPFDAGKWFWVVGSDMTRVYSSATGDFVPVENGAYQAWVASGGSPSRISSEAELGEVLAPLSIRPAHAGVLDGYKEKQATELTVAVAAKVLFNHENRMRALEGKAQISPAQFKNALKALM